MTFDYFKSVTAPQGEVCTEQLLMQVIDNLPIRRVLAQIAASAAMKDTKGVGQLKRHLPIVTWQASFKDGKRSNETAIPSGLFMLDVDHISDIRKFKEEIVDPLLANDNALAKEIGIVAIHITPSGSGMRFVCLCPQGMTTIEGCQQWLAAQLGIVTFDTACKDFARSSFLVSREYFCYLDTDTLFHGEPRNILPVDLSTRTESTSEPQSAVQQRTFSDEQKNFKYRDHLISEIAARWVAKHGAPQQGERHTYYYRLCMLFRYIVDGEIGILLAQLPDFGMGIAEREKEAEHACKRAMGTQIPYSFYKFLVSEEIIKAEATAEKVETIDLRDEAPTIAGKLPPLPPVFREFCKTCPPDFVYPTIVALLPVLGTLATRLRARYLDGREHTTSFIGVIFAPQSAGKSFARDIVTLLTKDLRKHDEVSILKEKQYKMELKMKKNSDQLPEDPHAPYRLVQAVISVPRLLQRQEDAGGLHQFSFTEEIDTLTKSNAGGSYAQKSDLYRQAFDNAEYGQDYISVDTFTGSVNLYYNLLMLGTPKQLYKFFPDAENGLVSRCCFAELENQEFASIPRFRPLSEKALEEITKVMNRFEAMTYRRKNAQSEDFIIQPVVNIDDKMQPIREALAAWLERTRLQALEANDVAFDVFRRRAAVKAFRLGMICVGMYERRSLTKARMKVITDFVLWFAQQDTEQVTKAFGKLLNETQPQQAQPERKSLLASLPEIFTAGDLIVQIRKSGKRTAERQILYKWKRAGLIKQNEDLTFTKVKKS